jgi:hypothetical protein
MRWRVYVYIYMRVLKMWRGQAQRGENLQRPENCRMVYPLGNGNHQNKRKRKMTRETSTSTLLVVVVVIVIVSEHITPHHRVVKKHRAHHVPRGWAQ